MRTEFPVKIKDISKFESQNDISINVFAIEFDYKSIVGPLHLTNKTQKCHINLLLIEGLNNNLSRLISYQITKKKNKKYFCNRCLTYFN